MFVEPQEDELYLCEAKRVLPENDQGIAYARNSILDYAQEQGESDFWMLDDDISGFYRIEGMKCLPCGPREALISAQSTFKMFKCAQGSLEYRQFAWSTNGKTHHNSYCDAVVWMDTEQTKPFKYDPSVNLKEDRDFTLQLVSAGLKTCRCSRYAFAAPANASNEGGLHEVYKSGRETKAVEAMCAKWPAVCTKQIKQNGRVDCKIDWKSAASKQIAFC